MTNKNNKNPEKKQREEYIRSKQGTERYNMSRNTFLKIASDAGALYKVRGVCLVKVSAFEEYLETFQTTEDDYY